VTPAPPEIGLGRGRVTTFHASETWLVAAPAVASVATLLARWGQRVLLVDWDLDGPGLEQLFPGRVVDGERTGLVDLAEARRSGTPLDWRECVVEIPVSQEGPVGQEGPALRMITAGRRHGRHSQRLRRVDWRTLFTEADFGAHLERMRTEWVQEHDFVLVNSPAGLSAATTICTVYLPDVLVALYAANPGSVEGVADMAVRARRARSGLPYDRGHLVVLPLPAWDERSGSSPHSGGGLPAVAERLNWLYRDVLPREVGLGEGLEVLRVPGRPGLGAPDSSSEGEGTPDLERVVDSYAVVARMVGSGLRWDISTRPDGGPAPISETADFFISYSDADRQWASWVAWVLEHAGYRVLMWAWDFVPGPDVAQRMARGVREATRTIALISPAYLGSVYGRAQWQAALAFDPRTLERSLLPVRIAQCQPEGLLASIAAVDLVGVDDETSAARRLLQAASEALTERGGARPEPPPLPPAESSGRPGFPWRMDAASHERAEIGQDAMAGRGADAAARHRAVAGISAWVSARARATHQQVQRLTAPGIAASLAAAALTALAAEDGGASAAARLGPAAGRLAGIMADVAARLRQDRATPVTREDLRDALAGELSDRLGEADATSVRRDVAALLRGVGGVPAALRAAFDSDRPVLQERLALAFIELAATEVEFGRLREDAFTALDALQQDFTEVVFSGRNRAERNRPLLREVTLLRQRLLASTGAQPGALAPEGPDESPYRGLAPFGVRDARWFHGRAASTAALVNRLAERLAGPSVVMVVGASGAGKSSLLNAGLLPAMRSGMLAVAGSETWPQVLMHPGASPVHWLAVRVGEIAEMEAEVVERQIRTDPTAFAATVWQAAGGRATRRVLLVVDQFEELFTLCPDRAERHDFIRALRAIATPMRQTGAAPAAIVLGLRADRYADCTGHPELMALLDGGQVVVGPMTAGEVREAIEKPAETAGLTLEPGLVEVILHDLDPRLTGGQPGGYDPGRLPLLSHALLATWQRRSGRVLDLAGYQAAGGIDGAITNTADRLFERLDADEQRMVRRVLLQLVSVSENPAEDARARVRRQELLATGGEGERRAIESALDRLVEARLVTASEDHFEITHEALLHAWPRLRGWIDDDRDWLPVRRHLSDAAAGWARAGRAPSELYSPIRLAEVHETIGSSWRAELGPLESSFLAASNEQVSRRRRAERRRSRSRRALAALLVALLVATAFLAVVALQQKATADTQRNRADSRQVVAEAEAAALRTTDPGLAAELGVQAYRLEQSAETRSVLLGARAPEYRELAAPGVTAVAVSPVGDRLAAAGPGGGIELWDRAAGTRTTLGGGAGASAVYAVAFSPDGATVAGASAGGDVSLWDVGSGQPRGGLSGHRGPVNSVAFSADGRLIVTGGSDGTTRLWDAASRASVAVLTGPGVSAGPIVGVAFSPDGTLVATAGGNTKVVLWDVARRVALAVLPAGNTPVRAVKFSTDGQTLASTDDSGSVTLWDVAHRSVVATVPATSIGPIRAVAFAPDGRTLAVGGDGGGVELWRVDPKGLAPLGSLNGSLASVVALAFGPDSTLVAAESNSRIGLWDLGGSSLLADPPVTGQVDPSGVTLGPRASGLVATAGTDGTIRLWRASDGSAFWTVPGAGRGADAATGASSRAISMARAPDGRTLLATPAGPGVVAIWDVGSRQQIARFSVDSPAVTALAFSPDGRLVATTSPNSVIQLWSVQSPQHPVREITNSLGVVKAMAFSPDGRIVASASDDGTIDLSDVRSGGLIGLPLIGHLGVVGAVAFSADGATVASGDDSGTVRLWSVASHTPLGPPLTGLVGAVESVAFSPDGHTVAWAGVDGGVTLWSIRDGGLLATLGGHGDVTAVAFSPDGSTLYGSGAGGGLLSWDTNPDRITRWICAAHAPLTPDQWRQHMPSDQPPRATCP
jgi:WD40 repeat protein